MAIKKYELRTYYYYHYHYYDYYYHYYIIHQKHVAFLHSVAFQVD